MKFSRILTAFFIIGFGSARAAGSGYDIGAIRSALQTTAQQCRGLVPSLQQWVAYGSQVYQEVRDPLKSTPMTYQSGPATTALPGQIGMVQAYIPNVEQWAEFLDATASGLGDDATDDMVEHAQKAFQDAAAACSAAAQATETLRILTEQAQGR